MFVCLSRCHTNQIIRFEDEKVNLIENSLLKNNWLFEEQLKIGKFFRLEKVNNMKFFEAQD